MKEQLKKNRRVFGTWCMLPSAEVVSVLCKSGLDFVLIDFEHSPIDFIVAQSIVTAATAEGKRAIIRVSKLDEIEILKALDIGAEGIIVPHVQTSNDVGKIVKYAKYPPLGSRGYSPYTSAGSFHIQDGGGTAKANGNCFIGVIIEDKTGLSNLSEIVKNPSIDIVYIGVYDISVSLGCPGEVDNPLVRNAIDQICNMCIRLGVKVGCMFHTIEGFKYLVKCGVNFLVYKTDTFLLYESLDLIRQEKGVK
jgi:4-hydroxy-2-oxoheptanedioate aldolase